MARKERKVKMIGEGSERGGKKGREWKGIEE